MVPLTLASFLRQAKLTAPDGAARDEFGRSVAVNGDTLVVGARYADIPPGSSQNQGAAYVFVKSGGVWTPKAKLISSDRQMRDWLGVSVAVSGDTVVVGAPFADIDVIYNEHWR